jgi:hypothetical protein
VKKTRDFSFALICALAPLREIVNFFRASSDLDCGFDTTYQWVGLRTLKFGEVRILRSGI